MTEPITPDPAAGTPKAGDGTPATPPVNPPATPPPAGDKPGGAPPAVPPAGSDGKRVVPDAYTLTLPKDSLLDQAKLDEVAAYAKAEKLTNEEAQKILERESATIATYVDNARKAADEAFKVTQQEWLKELQDDKTFGGDNFVKNAELAKRVVTRFDPEGSFQKELEESGFGNHPGFNRFMLNLGKAMTEDQLVPPTAPPQSKERKSTANVLFGDDKK